MSLIAILAIIAGTWGLGGSMIRLFILGMKAQSDISHKLKGYRELLHRDADNPLSRRIQVDAILQNSTPSSPQMSLAITRLSNWRMGESESEYELRDILRELDRALDSQNYLDTIETSDPRYHTMVSNGTQSLMLTIIGLAIYRWM